MYLLITKIVPSFANSAGCKPKPPILNHALAPPTSLPTNKTSINEIIHNKYII